MCVGLPFACFLARGVAQPRTADVKIGEGQRLPKQPGSHSRGTRAPRGTRRRRQCAVRHGNRSITDYAAIAQFRRAYQSKTRRARNVIQRFGAPTVPANSS